MRLRHLSVAGFRGFNSQRDIDFDGRLTLISAPNSHGKTSIAEALEFLLYGETSKVSGAKAREEFKNSYRNCHYFGSEPAFIRATFLDDQGAEIALAVEIGEGERQSRFVNGQSVAAWPFAAALAKPGRPFVVQHQLKELLLTTPVERFQGFARILGLESIDAIQRSLVSLATKPEANLSPLARTIVTTVDQIKARIDANGELKALRKALERTPCDWLSVRGAIAARLRILGIVLPPESDLLAVARASREEATKKVYDGSITINDVPSVTEARLGEFREKLSALVAPAFVERVSRLDARQTIQRLQYQATFLKAGIEMLAVDDTKCPFCLQAIGEDTRNDIHARSSALATNLASAEHAQDDRQFINGILNTVSSNLSFATSAVNARFSGLIAAQRPGDKEKITSLLGAEHTATVSVIDTASGVAQRVVADLEETEGDFRASIESARAKLDSDALSLDEVEKLVNKAAVYVAKLKAAADQAAILKPRVQEPARVLQAAVDAVAGTGELTLLIDVLEQEKVIGQGVRIRQLLDRVKLLKKPVEQAVAEVMEAAFSRELTQSVMHWYDKIKTKGDPNVHFSGMAMEKNKSGDYRSGKVRIGARSYGVDLASAVSSLSESKLNALGLCVSIASALRSECPFQFLLLDDPVQSWDADHETQFRSIVRSLIEDENRQVILLSHRDSWVDSVADFCRDINGCRHQIKAYDKDGPVISERQWTSLDNRLTEALAIAQNSHSTSTELQRGEGELRLAAHQLAANIARSRNGQEVSTKNMSAQKVREILVRADCPTGLVSRVASIFSSVDASHHVDPGYEVARERVRSYHGALCELRSWADKT